MKKIFSAMVIAAALFAGYSGYSGQNSNELADVALANVEALANGSDNNEFKCVMEKVSCKPKINANAQIPLLKKWLPNTEIVVGATVDLTDLTQIFREKKEWESGVKCGTNVTCYELLERLGL